MYAWLHEAELRVREIVAMISHEDTNEVQCGPRPFSMAGADMVSDVLRIAEHDRVSFERFDTDISIGRSLDDAVEFAVALDPAWEIIRLAGKVGEESKGEVIAALREIFADHLQADGVMMPSSSWLVTARNGRH